MRTEDTLFDKSELTAVIKSDQFATLNEVELQQLLGKWQMLEVEVRLPLLPLLIKHPSQLVDACLMKLADESSNDVERCSYLGGLTLRGNRQGAESLLEMEAILGGHTVMGKEAGKILYHYILANGEDLAKTLLRESNVSKIRSLVKHLRRMREAAKGTGSPQPAVVDKLLTEMGRLAASSLQSGSAKQRRAAIELLVISPIILPLWLTKAFREDHIYVRAMVMRIINLHLHEYGYDSFPGASPESLAKLVLKGLQDPSPLVREKAVLCLKMVQVPNKTGFLLQMATSGHEVLKVRLAAISTLSELLSPAQLEQLLVDLRNDNRFPIRLFVRELEQEIKNPGSDMEESTYSWQMLFSEAGHPLKVDSLLASWLEQMQLPPEERYEQGIAQELAREVDDEYGVRQVLDFYGEWEDRFLNTGNYRESVDKLTGLKQLLRIFSVHHVPILAHILTVEKDLQIRLSAIEALSELVLENVEVELIKEVLLNHLQATHNPPDQERTLSVLYVFPREAYLGLVVPFLSSPSPQVAVRAASILSSFEKEQVSCYNSKRIIDQIMRNVRNRQVFGKFWADLTVYTARISNQDECGHLANYLEDADYIVRRFAREVRHHVSKMAAEQ